MTDTSDAFDWVHDENIVIHEQRALAVYGNPKGHIVIRQERAWNEEEDPFFTLDPRHVLVFCHAVLTAAGHGDIQFIRPSGGGYVDVDIEAPAAPMARDETDDDEQKTVTEPPLLAFINDSDKEVLIAAE